MINGSCSKMLLSLEVSLYLILVNILYLSRVMVILWYVMCLELRALAGRRSKHYDPIILLQACTSTRSLRRVREVKGRLSSCARIISGRLGPNMLSMPSRSLIGSAKFTSRNAGPSINMRQLSNLYPRFLIEILLSSLIPPVR